MTSGLDGKHSLDKIVIDDANQTDKVKIEDAINNQFVSIGEKLLIVLRAVMNN